MCHFLLSLSPPRPSLTYRKQIAAEFQAMREKRKTQKLIEISKESQACRMSVMELRHKKMQELRQAVIERLVGIEKHAQYPALIQALIVQGLIALQENKVVVRCRKEDASVVNSVLQKAADEYIKFVKESTGYTPLLQPLKLDTEFLPPAYKNPSTEYCSGGVVLIAQRGRIVCNNTLDARLDIAFEQLTPQIRGMLFGVRPPSNKGAAAPAGHGHGK